MSASCIAINCENRVHIETLIAFIIHTTHRFLQCKWCYNERYEKIDDDNDGFAFNDDLDDECYDVDEGADDDDDGNDEDDEDDDDDDDDEEVVDDEDDVANISWGAMNVPLCISNRRNCAGDITNVNCLVSGPILVWNAVLNNE